MSAKASRRQNKGGERRAESSERPPGRIPAPAAPLMPRPVLFWILLAAFVLWLGALVGLFYGT